MIALPGIYFFSIRKNNDEQSLRSHWAIWKARPAKFLIITKNFFGSFFFPALRCTKKTHHFHYPWFITGWRQIEPIKKKEKKSTQESDDGRTHHTSVALQLDPNYLRFQKFLNPLIERVPRSAMMGQIELIQRWKLCPLVGRFAAGCAALEYRMNEMLAHIVEFLRGRFGLSFRFLFCAIWFSVDTQEEVEKKKSKQSFRIIDWIIADVGNDAVRRLRLKFLRSIEWH